MRLFSRYLLPLMWVALVVPLAGLSLATPAAYALPPRFTPTPAPVRPNGVIELQVLIPPPAAFAVVQWQGAPGVWNDVSTWQSSPDSAGLVRWGVAPADGGRGPFRWAVYAQPGGALWAVSDTFYLPSPGQTVHLTLSAPAPTLAPAATAFSAGPAYTAFALAPQGVVYTSRPNFCASTSIAGQIVDRLGVPLPQAAFRLWLVTPSGQKRWVLAGQPWQFEFVLGAPLETGVYQLQLQTPDKRAVSPLISVDIQPDCSRNLAWVVFQSAAP